MLKRCNGCKKGFGEGRYLSPGGCSKVVRQDGPGCKSFIEH
jgi:hypothetical protein